MSRQSKRDRERDEQLARETEAQRQLDEMAVARDRERTPPGQFLREVRQELKKVAWPTRSEVLNYTAVVLVATAFLIGITFAFDYVFGELVIRVYGG